MAQRSPYQGLIEDEKINAIKISLRRLFAEKVTKETSFGKRSLKRPRSPKGDLVGTLWLANLRKHLKSYVPANRHVMLICFDSLTLINKGPNMSPTRNSDRLKPRSACASIPVLVYMTWSLKWTTPDRPLSQKLEYRWNHSTSPYPPRTGDLIWNIK